MNDENEEVLKIIKDPQEFCLRVLYFHELHFGVWGGKREPVT